MSNPDVEYLSMSDVLEIAARTLREFDVREPGLLALAAARPQMSAFGADAYPSLPDKGAGLMHSIARNHPLVDGNKRLAFMSAWTFFGLNGFALNPPSVDEGEDVVLRVARGELEGEELSRVLQSWLVRRPHSG